MRIAAQVLDGTYGRAADGIRVYLERSDENGWSQVSDARTDSDGRVTEWVQRKLGCGLYRITFDTDNYFAGLGASTAYPEVPVVFRLQNDADLCQLQVTLSPYSYSTHFGADSP